MRKRAFCARVSRNCPQAVTGVFGLFCCDSSDDRVVFDCIPADPSAPLDYYYQDLQGALQGPFAAKAMLEWFKVSSGRFSRPALSTVLMFEGGWWVSECLTESAYRRPQMGYLQMELPVASVPAKAPKPTESFVALGARLAAVQLPVAGAAAAVRRPPCAQCLLGPHSRATRQASLNSRALTPAASS